MGSVWRSQNRSDRIPSAMQTRLDRGFVDADFSRPIGDAHGPLVDGDKSIQAIVTVLLGVRGPMAILRTVTLIVVNAVKREAFRTSAHIVEEVPKVMPPLAHRNPATAIVRESGIIRVLAATKHGGPRVVLLGCRPSCVAVTPGSFSAKTSTTCGPVRLETVRGDERFSPAITSASPDDIVSFSKNRRFNRREASHSYPGQILHVASRHACNYIADGAMR